MNGLARVLILMAIDNGEKHLAQQMDSMLAQCMVDRRARTRSLFAWRDVPRALNRLRPGGRAD